MGLLVHWLALSLAYWLLEPAKSSRVSFLYDESKI